MNACPVQFDPLAPEQLADPYPVYSQLRADRPVFHDAEHDLWIVSRYEDVMIVVREPETYSSENAVRASTQPWPRPVLDTLARGWPLSPTLTDSDGDVHRRLRLLVSRAFTPKRIADMEDTIRRAVDELIDAFVSDGCADIIERFAWPLPMMAITAILGVPREDVPRLHRWSYNWLRLMQATDPVGELVACAEDVVAMQRYFMDALEQRAGGEGTDLMSGLLGAGVAGSEALTMIEAMRVPMNLIIAGHVTVTRAIGNGLVTLLSASDQLAAVQQDPERIPTMVEEILRFESPAQGLFRTVRTDTTLAGVHIPAGARVMVHWASGNRDENVFERADVFDVTRNSANAHLAFGKGSHACLGAPLARLQLKVAIPRLFERLPRLQVAAGEASAVRDTIFFARGFKKLAMEWDVPVAAART
ncbi:cytochrome P450 [Pseudonocardia alaniniphila]|uniref:Cytochrome P450 n=1 Tax=Pseudonocardia alaniniphila TaxID=75291 RepID=A0ABS9TQX6_9PSEU|nr:cytochrome P450 [Pseudonocardia alaniniphila]MCH6170952.1 cytochrome P450 [Pseudonocardia alaniniphila]